MSENPTTRAYVDIWPDPWTDAGQSMRGPERCYVEVIGYRVRRGVEVARVRICTGQTPPYGASRVLEVDAEEIEFEYVP